MLHFHIRVAIAEEFGVPIAELPPGKLVAAIRQLGFDLVLDVNTAADLTICEEGTELLNRLKAEVDSGKTSEMPLFTSCCPGWMTFVEKSKAEDVVENISTTKSPHMMYGAVLKEFRRELLGRDQVYLTSVMPCIKKRGESDRPCFVRTQDGRRDVDNVITTKDLGQLLRRAAIDPTKLEAEVFDSPFQTSTDGAGTGAGQLFGATGGVMEAAVRSVYELVVGKELPRIELDEVRGLDGVKEATLPLYDEATGQGMSKDLRIAVVSGLANVKHLLKKLEEGEVQYDFVEVMACPGGCINGGGQPKGGDIQARMNAIYELDRSLPRRKSHENPIVAELYDKFMEGEWGGKTAHLFAACPTCLRGSLRQQGQG